jgi:magnesium chelatase subunit D
MPVHITEDRLVGGLALAETLRHGRPIVEPGVLARADGGLVVCATAERMPIATASVVCATLDSGEIVVERDGLSVRSTARIALVLLDEGSDGESVPASLRDRVALDVDLDALPILSSGEVADLLNGPALEAESLRPAVMAARGRMVSTTIGGAALDALSEGCVELGIGSLRAPVLAAHVATLHAALEGRGTVEADDLSFAARLVLASRATRGAVETRQHEEGPPEPPSAPESENDSRDPDESPQEGAIPTDVVVEAASSAIGTGLLDGLRPTATRSSRSVGGRHGSERIATTGGRPAGVRPARGDAGERINVVETLRAAAPWQRMRGRDDARVRVHGCDLRVNRRIERTETTVIFCVDVSGSSATQRLAEAKGAIETILRDCYARRDQVAVVAFRRSEASLALPPTRSLVRARRCLAGIVGGGATPLAHGLDEGLAVALDARRRGRAPLLVVMTDGRANVGLDGRTGGEAGVRDAHRSARAIREQHIPTLLVDTSPRPRDVARMLAKELGATYVPLPHAGSERIPMALDSMRASRRGELRV